MLLKKMFEILTRLSAFNSGGTRIFPEGAPTLRFGRQDTNLLNFSQKLHEIEKNVVARGGGRPLDPPTV